MDVAVLLIGVVISVLLLYYMWTKRKEYLVSFQLNGPWSYPIIGNGAHFLGDTSKMVKILPNLSKKYGSPMRLWFGSTLVIYISKPDHIQKILTSPKIAYKKEFYDVLQSYAGDGLITNFGGYKYRQHKRIIQPLFNSKYISENFESYEREINVMLELLGKHTDGKAFDVHEYIHYCFVDIIGETFLGVKMDAQKGKSREFCEGIDWLYGSVYERVTKPWLKLKFIYDLTPQKRQQTKILKLVYNLFENAIFESKKRIENDQNQNTYTASIIDLIHQAIMSEPGAINSKDLFHHLFTLYLASEDTVTLMGATLCVCFGMYPEYQKLAFEEIRNVIGEEQTEITYEDVHKLLYLDMCVRDVLRVMPIAPFIFRKPIEDFELDNFIIPESSNVAISIMEVHRDPNLWENPEHFHPDHFLPEAVEKRHPYAYIPFSSGGRGCIGKVFATVTLKLLLVKILQKYEIEADGKLPDMELKNDISVRSVHGYKIRLKKRVWN